jgi:hypothetical protein
MTPLGKAKTDTAYECPDRVCLHLPVSTSQIFAVLKYQSYQKKFIAYPSQEPDTISSLNG